MNYALACRLAVLSICLLFTACTTVVTSYHRQSYVELNSATRPILEPYSGTPQFAQVEDMTAKALDLYGDGYVMLGYSQFVSPLHTSLAESYSTLWGEELRAAYVVLETPRKAMGLNHGYLVTYWARGRSDRFSFGAYFQDLPKDLLEQIGDEFNVVIVRQAVKGSPAANAGVQANDVLLALDGVRVVSAVDFATRLRDYAGKPVTLSISRKGERRDLSLTPAVLSDAGRASVAADAGGAPLYRDAPWLNTQPTDWSRLGDIAAISAASVQNYQRMEQQRQIQYERAQAQMQRNLASLESSKGPATRYEPPSRRGGGPSSAGPDYPTREEMARELRGFNERMERYWTNRGKVQKTQIAEIWVDNFPNIYSQIFTFPRPKAR